MSLTNRKNFLNRKINITNNSYYLPNKSYIISGSSCFLNKRQVDSCLNTIRFYIRKYKKKNKNKNIFINCIQYTIPVTQKNKNSRMGAGKGRIKKYLSKINMNSILFIFKNIKQSIILKLYKQIQYKLPMKIHLKS